MGANETDGEGEDVLMKKVYRILMWVFGLIGLVFLMIAIGFAAEQAVYERGAEKTQAQIVDIVYDGSGDYWPIVAYTVDGVEYEQRLNGYSSTMRVGDPVTIWYQTENPQNCRWDGMAIFPLVFGIMGGAFLLATLIVSLVSRKRSGQEEELRTYGTLVNADIATVETRRNIQANGKHPHVVVLKWDDPQSGETLLLRSDLLWKDPRPMIKERALTQLPVYIDPYQKKRYFVLTDGLEEKG